MCSDVHECLLPIGKPGNEQFISPTSVLAEVFNGFHNPFRSLHPKRKLVCVAEQMAIPSPYQHLRFHLVHHEHLLQVMYVVRGFQTLLFIPIIVRMIGDKQGHCFIFLHTLIVDKLIQHVLEPHLRIVQNDFITSNRTSSAAFASDVRYFSGAGKISPITSYSFFITVSTQNRVVRSTFPVALFFRFYWRWGFVVVGLCTVMTFDGSSTTIGVACSNPAGRVNWKDPAISGSNVLNRSCISLSVVSNYSNGSQFQSSSSILSYTVLCSFIR